MNIDQFRGTCRQFRGRLKQSLGVLIADPVMEADGLRDRLDGRILEQRGVSQQEADRQLQEFMSRNRRWWDLSQ